MLLASYAFATAANVGDDDSSSAKGSSASARSRRNRSCSPTCRPTTSQVTSGLGERHAAQHHRAAGAVRRPGEGGDGTGVVRDVQPDAPGVPRSAHRIASASCSTRSKPTCGRKICSSNRNRWPRNCRAGRKNCSRPTRSCKEKARLLAEQNAEVERKNSEVEQARQALEEKAKQLALTSKYKSEFLANMSHELRTPLNSLLILVRSACRRTPTAISPAKQTEFAKTIHSSGNDLLTLINDILDLSKIESGTVVLDIGELRFADLHDLRRAHVPPRRRSQERRLPASTSIPTCRRRCSPIASACSRSSRTCCPTRSNSRIAARSSLDVRAGSRRLEPRQRCAQPCRTQCWRSRSRDTGIGIPPEKQQIIFEAFQQADGSTSRKYGGTGLGLAISREIARLLGRRNSAGQHARAGSTFTLYLPQTYTPDSANPCASTRCLPMGDQCPASSMSLGCCRRHRTGRATAWITKFGDDRSNIQPGDRVLLSSTMTWNSPVSCSKWHASMASKAWRLPWGPPPWRLTHEYQSRCDHARHLSAGYRRMARARPAQKRSHDRHIPVYVLSTED